MKVKAVFLDRDGVLNKYPGHGAYVKSWSEFEFLPGVQEALKKLNQHGFKIFVVSNQAGVAKGIYSQPSLDLLTRNMLDELTAADAKIEDVYYCTHKSEDNCRCRKPKTGLIDLAIAKLKHQGLELDLDKSYFIGDSIRDVETGQKAGLKTILVFSGRERPENKDSWQTQPDFTTRDLSTAVNQHIFRGLKP